MSQPFRPALYVALDTADAERARHLLAQLAPHVDGVKIGLTFLAAHGPEGVRHLLSPHNLRLFLDMQVHDIPTVAARTVAALLPLHPHLLSVHASGGLAMLRATHEAAAAHAHPPSLVAIGVLTSLTRADLTMLDLPADTVTHSRTLAALARTAGLAGMVCAGGEVAALRADWPEALLVVPGVRLPNAETADQKRLTTPQTARVAGASILLVGRPITEAASPATAAAEIRAQLRPALPGESA